MNNEDRVRWLTEMKHPEFVAQYRFVKAKCRCEYWADKSKIIYLLVRFIYEHYKVKYNTDIPARCKIGGDSKYAILEELYSTQGLRLVKM